MRTLIVALLLFAGVAPGARAVVFAQGELVIVKEGTTEYHRPGCRVIRDGKNVLAMTRAQAESRGLKSHPGCEAAVAEAAPETGQPAKPPAPVYVYTDSSKYYHRQDCRKLAAEASKVLLEDAGRKFWPCPVCRPPIRKKSSEPAVRIRR